MLKHCGVVLLKLPISHGILSITMIFFSGHGLWSIYLWCCLVKLLYIARGIVCGMCSDFLVCILLSC